MTTKTVAQGAQTHYNDQGFPVTVAGPAGCEATGHAEKALIRTTLAQAQSASLPTALAAKKQVEESGSAKVSATWSAAICIVLTAVTMTVSSA